MILGIIKARIVPATPNIYPLKQQEPATQPYSIHFLQNERGRDCCKKQIRNCIITEIFPRGEEI